MIVGALVLLMVGAYFAWDRGLPLSGPGDGPVKVGVAMTVIGVIGTRKLSSHLRQLLTAWSV